MFTLPPLKGLRSCTTGCRTLCQIEQPALDQLVQEGSVYPALTLRQAEVLPYLLGQKRWKKRTRPAVKAGLRSFRRFVTATLNDWSSKQRQFTSDSLRDLLLRIEQETHHA